MLPADSNPFALPRDTMADRLAKLEKAYRRYPDSPLFARLADLYLDRGKTEEALEVCRRGCQHFPDYATGFLVLSKCYEAQGEVEQARDALDQSLRIDPVNPGGYRRLSGIYQKLGEPTLALKTLEQAAELDPLAEDLGEQVDQLTYQVRLESTRQTSQDDEVDPVVDVQSDPVGQILMGGASEANEAIEEVEDAEPFAQMQALPEWDDGPDVSAVLEEFKQEPNALFTEGQGGADSAEEQLVEKSSPPEIGDIAALLGLDDDGDEEEDALEEGVEQTAGAGSSEENSDSAGAVAALGMEVMGTSTETVGAQEESDETEEADFSSPFDPALMEQEVEEVEEEESSEEDEEVSIFSPDILPEDSEVFQPLEEIVSEVESDPVAEAIFEVESDPVAETVDEEEPVEDGEVSIFSPDILPEDSEVFQPLEEVESEVEPDSGAEAILAEELDPVEEAAVDEVVMPSNPSPAAEGALDRDALNDILSALKNDEPEAAVAPELAVDDGSGEALEAETEQPLETGVTDGLEDEVDVEEEAISQEQEPLAVENVSEENAPRPAIDLGPLIEAMAGMGKTSPEAAPRTAADEVVGEPEAAKEEGLAVDEEIDSIADLEPPAAAAEEVAPIAPVEAFDLSDLEPPTVAAEEVAPVGPVEAFDLSDLEPPTVAAEEVAPIAPVEAFDLSDLEPPAADVEEVESVGNTAVSEEISEELEVDLDELEDTQETEPSVAEREGAGSRGVGFNMRGDDELLRIFQEIETEGHIDDEVDDEAEREPEVEQEKRIATATLAEIYTIQGLTQKAIETYRELLGQEPDNAFIRRKLEDLEKGSSRK